jgi:hypothetical protein
MIRWLLLRPYLVAEPWLRHPNWLVRRVAQVAALTVAAIWLVLPGGNKAESQVSERGRVPEQNDELAEQLSSSPRLREFLHGSAIATPLVGRVCRVLVLRLSVHAKIRERATSEGRNFALRLNGPIDQIVLRNLLVWQNHALPSSLRPDDDSQVDVALALTNRSESEARLFDLFSAALMLERIRSFAVFWDEESAAGGAPVLTSERELLQRRTAGGVGDLANMPCDMIRQVELHGTRGGVKLFHLGRKYANDFLKVALPGRFVVAVGLREREDGTVAPEELRLWLSLIDKLHARNPQTAFVVLNCLPPSQWREWPAHLRFPRHQGLTLPDTICLAQIADGYLGVLDLFGLAAHSAGRPGVYVPLEDRDLRQAERFAANWKVPQIMVGNRDRADIETALDNFLAALPQQRASGPPMAPRSRGARTP